MRSPTNETYVRELLARIERKDQAALRELHGLFAKRIYAFAMRRLRDSDESETIVSETLFAVWKNPTAFRFQSQLSTWLLGIARNKILMTLRDRKPQHESLDEVTLDEELVSEDLGSYEIFADKELREGLIRCMEGLSALHRECLHLVFFEEMTLTEVAQLQGCPEVTARTRLFYARKNVKDCVAKLLGWSA